MNGNLELTMIWDLEAIMHQEVRDGAVQQEQSDKRSRCEKAECRLLLHLDLSNAPEFQGLLH